MPDFRICYVVDRSTNFLYPSKLTLSSFQKIIRGHSSCTEGEFAEAFQTAREEAADMVNFQFFRILPYLTLARLQQESQS